MSIYKNAVFPSITVHSSLLCHHRILAFCVPGCRTGCCTVTTYLTYVGLFFSSFSVQFPLPPASRIGADMHLCYLA